MSRPDLSVILPMYDEASVVDACLSTVIGELEKTGLEFEILCVDDGSRDETLEILRRRERDDPRIRASSLSRNFGKEAAICAGLELAGGRAVLILDADLQHPPELIGSMLAKWEDGADVVSAVKTDRTGEQLGYRAAAAVFNRLMGRTVGRTFQGASDFKLLDRQVVDALLQCPERHRFFRGLVAWVGFRTAEVPLEVRARHSGTTKWSLQELAWYSVRNILSFSSFPLRLVAGVGFSVLAFTGSLAVWTLYRYWRGDSLAGFPTVILLQLILGSLVLCGLGVVSLYLAEMYDELKRRPTYLFRIPRQGGEPGDETGDRREDGRLSTRSSRRG